LHNLGVYLHPKVSSKCPTAVFNFQLGPPQLNQILPPTPPPPKKNKTNGTNFEMKNVIIEKKKSNFCTSLSKKIFILRKTERGVVKYVYWALCKVPFILVRFE